MPKQANKDNKNKDLSNEKKFVDNVLKKVRKLSREIISKYNNLKVLKNDFEEFNNLGVAIGSFALPLTCAYFGYESLTGLSFMFSCAALYKAAKYKIAQTKYFQSDDLKKIANAKNELELSLNKLEKYLELTKGYFFKYSSKIQQEENAISNFHNNNENASDTPILEEQDANDVFAHNINLISYICRIDLMAGNLDENNKFSGKDVTMDMKELCFRQIVKRLNEVKNSKEYQQGI